MAEQYKLPQLPYDFAELEPVISARPGACRVIPTSSEHITYLSLDTCIFQKFLTTGTAFSNHHAPGRPFYPNEGAVMSFRQHASLADPCRLFRPPPAKPAGFR